MTTASTARKRSSPLLAVLALLLVGGLLPRAASPVAAAVVVDAFAVGAAGRPRHRRAGDGAAASSYDVPRRGFCSWTATARGPTTTMFGISEWRDLIFDYPGTGDDRRLGKADLQAPPREICVLPFPFRDVLLQGETKQLRLYEDRFIELFDDATSNHCGVVAMGLLAESGIVQTVPLCEIEAYNRMEGFGIFVTIRVVSRAKLLEIVQQEPYIKAACVELADEVPPNLELPNLAASNIENLVLLLSSMEHRLATSRNGTDGDGEEEVEEDDDVEMQSRINVARLEDKFYEEEDSADDDGDDDEDDDDDDDDDDGEPDRRARFRHAYQVALDTDTQGYRVVAATKKDRDGGGKKKSTRSAEFLRSPRELAAISWAAFCTEESLSPEEQIPPTIQDLTYRIQALDCENLMDRLKLALHMLRAKKEILRAKMKKAGLKFRNYGEDENGDFPPPESSSSSE